MKLIFPFVIIGVIGLAVWSLYKTDSEMKTPVQTNQIVPTLRVVAAGDISCSDFPMTSIQCQMQSTADLVKRLNPDLLLALGDTQYDEVGLQGYLKYYDKSWGEFKNKTLPAVGNHEYEEANAEGYFDYFNGAGNKTGLAGDRDKGYYSFEKNGWKFIVLNSNCWAVGGCEADSPQGQWLKNELTNGAEICQLAYFHHPLYSSGQHGINKAVRPLWEILYNSKIEIVLNGHDHIYERFGLQDFKGQASSDGVREFVVGTGGRNLYQIKTILPNSEKRINDQFGVLELELKGNQYSWKFISIDNRVLDQGADSCHVSQTSR